MASDISLPVIYAAYEEDECAKTLGKALPGVEVIFYLLDETGILPKAAKKTIEENAEIFFAGEHPIQDVMHTAKKLKWAESLSVGAGLKLKGVDTIMKGLGKEPPNITLTRCAGVSSRAVAEYVLGQIIIVERKFYDMCDKNSTKDEKESLAWTPCRSLSELTIGVLGGGNIGSEVSRLCKAAGMKVWTLTRTPRQTSEYDMNVTADDLPKLLQHCDYVCNVLPSTKETRGLLSGEILKHCQKKRPVFINAGRGDVIDEISLTRALREQWIGGAVLDVFPVEPLPKTSELWSLPNVIITPHIATCITMEPYAEHFKENYHRYTTGRQLIDIVDWDRGY